MKIIRLFILLVLTWSCNSNKKKVPSINNGNINIGIDESLSNVIGAETDAYMVQYPGAVINSFSVPENEAIKLFLMDSMDVIATTRLLNVEELEMLGTKRQVNYIPAPMALDAVVLIVNPNFKESEISLSKLKELFTGADKTYKLVFDNSNSSNLNLIMDKLGVKDFSRENVVSAGGNEKVFDWVKVDKNAIGIIGYNMISEKYSGYARSLKEAVKIMAVKDSSIAVLPDKSTILDQSYPLFRIVYLHTLTSTWGVENGLIRYACSKPGQLIAEKMGLVPYYIIPKEFLLNTGPMD